MIHVLAGLWMFMIVHDILRYSASIPRSKRILLRIFKPTVRRPWTFFPVLPGKQSSFFKITIGTDKWWRCWGLKMQSVCHFSFGGFGFPMFNRSFYPKKINIWTVDFARHWWCLSLPSSPRPGPFRVPRCLRSSSTGWRHASESRRPCHQSCPWQLCGPFLCFFLVNAAHVIRRYNKTISISYDICKGVKNYSNQSKRYGFQLSQVTAFTPSNLNKRRGFWVSLGNTTC